MELSAFEYEKLIEMMGHMSKLAYALHDKPFIDDKMSEDLLEFWRRFSDFEVMSEEQEQEEGLEPIFECEGD